MDTFMESLIGKEFLRYEFDKKKVCYVSAEDVPKYECNHHELETEYRKNINCTPSSPALPTGEAIKKVEPQGKKQSRTTQRFLFPGSKPADPGLGQEKQRNTRSTKAD